MTETKYTPGPWSYNRDEGGYQGHVISTGDCIICDLPDAEDILAGSKLAAPQMEANARLIAAAPDMLDALRYIDNHCRELWAQDEKYRAGIAYILDATEPAIAKAEIDDRKAAKKEALAEVRAETERSIGRERGNGNSR